nr:hypothetical protein Iba_chr11bCG12930 [Ipomoea batatas]
MQGNGWVFLSASISGDQRGSDVVSLGGAGSHGLEPASFFLQRRASMVKLPAMELAGGGGSAAEWRGGNPLSSILLPRRESRSGCRGAVRTSAEVEPTVLPSPFSFWRCNAAVGKNGPPCPVQLERMAKGRPLPFLRRIPQPPLASPDVDSMQGNGWVFLSASISGDQRGSDVVSLGGAGSHGLEPASFFLQRRASMVKFPAMELAGGGGSAAEWRGGNPLSSILLPRRESRSGCRGAVRTSAKVEPTVFPSPFSFWRCNAAVGKNGPPCPVQLERMAKGRRMSVKPE